MDGFTMNSLAPVRSPERRVTIAGLTPFCLFSVTNAKREHLYC